jgi:hypothetical protein
VKRHGVVGTASLPHHPTRTRHVPGLVRNTRALLGVHRRRPWPQSSQYQSPRNDVSGPATALNYTLVNTRTRDSRNGGSLCMWRHRASRPLGKRRFRESNDAASQSIMTRKNPTMRMISASRDSRHAGTSQWAKQIHVPQSHRDVLSHMLFVRSRRFHMHVNKPALCEQVVVASTFAAQSCAPWGGRRRAPTILFAGTMCGL